MAWAVGLAFAGWMAHGAMLGGWTRADWIATAAVTVAIAALAAAVLLNREIRLLRGQSDAMARALDGMIPTIGRAPALSVEDINRIVGREVERLGATAHPAIDAATPGTPAAEEHPADGNVVPMPSPRRRRDARSKAEPRTGDLIARAVAESALELSLRPVVSLSRGSAAAFDVFGHFAGPDGQPLDVGRLFDEAPGLDRAGFERLLAQEALHASRRIVVDSTEAPLHVPVSAALLQSASDREALVARLRAHGSAARSIVFDLPAALLPAPDDVQAALDAFAGCGVGLAVECGDGDTADFGRLRDAGIGAVRFPVGRLLGRTRARKNHPSGIEVTDAAHAAGIAVIADGVNSDDDAMALVDLGVDLMTGPRFSGPRRLRGFDAASTAAE